MFDFLVESGLRPEHRLCDFGCGALRLGVWAIPYLDAGHYFGIDSHLESLEAAAAYEIPLHALEVKRPRLLWSQDFAFSHFGVQFDWVVDFSSSQKVDPPELPRLFGELAASLASGGRFLTAPRLVSAAGVVRRVGPDARPRGRAGPSCAARPRLSLRDDVVGVRANPRYRV